MKKLFTIIAKSDNSEIEFEVYAFDEISAKKRVENWLDNNFQADSFGYSLI